MANLLIRNLDEDVLKQLKAAAKAHGRSVQAEIHEVLRIASARQLAETQRLSAKWLKRLRGPKHSDSAALIREDCDTRERRCRRRQRGLQVVREPMRRIE